MARVTVEDCVKEISNRFELVILSAERAKNISSGTPMLIESDNDKYPVIALREIATGLIDTKCLRENKITSLQKKRILDEVEEENLYAEKREMVITS
jgi:DNA-directed RNA polymerase subunit omega